jgi:hypothetical protein
LKPKYRYNPRVDLNGSAPLPRALLHELSHPPSSGRHQWLARMACRLLWRRSLHEAEQLLRGACHCVTRDIEEREFKDALDSAATLVNQSKGTSTGAVNGSSRPKWPAQELEKTHQIVLAGPHQAEGCALSPVKLDPAIRHTETVIDTVYPGNPLLCVAHRGNWDFATAPREQYRGLLHLCQSLVPSPMVAPVGLTKNGKKLSAHTEAATGPRHILVVEFDIQKLDEEGKPTPWAPYIAEWEARGITIADACMALLLHLATTAPLILITWSGGKSLHGWFYCKGRSEAKLRAWMEYAVKLGADHQLWHKSQFCRVPDGTRHPGGRRQTLLYFNPDVL